MRLGEIFERQAELQEAFGFDFFKMSDQELVSYIKEYGLHAEHELHEMFAELPFFKPWSKKSNEMTKEERRVAFGKAREEYIDFFHFAIDVALALKLSPQDLYSSYLNKNLINHIRQKEGY